MLKFVKTKVNRSSAFL